MARQQGTKFKLYVVESGGTSKAIAHLRSNGISFEGESIDISTKSSENWRERLSGYRSYTIECDGVADFAPGSSAEIAANTLLTYFINGTTLTLKSTDGVSGSPTFTGQAIMTSFNITASHEDAVVFTATFEGTGAITIGTEA